MRLPSYLTLGGVGTKIKPFTQNKTDLTWTCPYSGLVSRKHDCSFFNPTNKSLDYTKFDIVVDKKISNILVILHFGDETGFNSALKWVSSSTSKDSMGHPKNYFLVTSSYGTVGSQICINYCKARREIAFIHYPEASYDVDVDDLRLNNGFTGWGTSQIWIDRITVGALDSDSISRLLQVPYGYDHLKPISAG